jgi:hypothetical protein
MQEKDFFCLLRCYNLDPNFIADLKTVPYENLRILGLTKINPFEFENKYFNRKIKNVTIDPNANVDLKSPNNFYMEATKPIFKLMTFHKIFQVGKKLDNRFTLWPLLAGYLYFHDSTKGYVPYCVGASCLDIIQNGRPYGEPISVPPKRADSYVAMCSELLMDMSQEFAGAVAFTDFLVGLAWFTSKEDSLDDKYIENRIQSFVHIANNKFRVGGDSISGSEEFLIRKDKSVKVVKIKDFCENFEKGWEIISFNPNYGKVEWREITNGIIHDNPNDFCEATISCPLSLKV